MYLSPPEKKRKSKQIKRLEALGVQRLTAALVPSLRPSDSISHRQARSVNCLSPPSLVSHRARVTRNCNIDVPGLALASCIRLDAILDFVFCSVEDVSVPRDTKDITHLRLAYHVISAYRVESCLNVPYPSV